jgi:glycosyltransferase involved in cell wall biosynthesis
MRVVHVVCTENFAGVERYVTSLAAELAARRCTVHVMGGHPRLMPAALGPAGVTWEPCASTLAALTALSRRRHDDLFHCHMTDAEAAGALAGLVRHTPLVSTRHFAQTRGTSLGGRAAAVLIRHRVSAQIAISDYVATHVEGPSVVIPNGVADAPPADRTEPVILMAQRLEQEKDTATGLRAWAASGLGDRGWHLELAGAGAEEASLRTLARALGIEASCRFLGFRSDIASCMARARGFLATSPGEPFGLSVLEAMARGLPVVATRAGAFTETVGRCPAARVFPPGDARSAARHLVALVDDPAGAQRYGAALRQLQRQRFTVAAMADATLELYGEVLAAPARHHHHRHGA